MPTAQNASKCHYNTENGWWVSAEEEKEEEKGGGSGGTHQRDRLVHPVIRLEMALLTTSGAFGGTPGPGGGRWVVTGSGSPDQYKRTRVKHGNGHGGAVGGG